MQKKTTNLLALLVLSFLFVSSNSFGQTKYYVNDNSTIGDIWCTAIGNNAAGRGLTPATPKLTLTSLLLEYSAAMVPGDTIKIEAGTYNNEVSLNFAKSGITFIGASNTLTIIDNLSAGTNTNYFMYITGNNVTFKDLTFKGYENNGTQTPGHSAQALTIGAGATGILIENVILTNNGEAGGNPSIVVLANSSTTIKGGGGLCNVWHSAYTGGVEAFGNGITLNIQDYILGYNFKTGAYDGGGLLINNANATTVVNVTNSRFYNNEASDGGAISQRGGVLNVTDCIIDANMAGQILTPIYGGGLRMTGGTATFTRTKFTNNIKGSAGGTLRGAAIGLYSLDANITLTLDNCFFSGNVGDEGDDLYADKYMSKTINVYATNTTFSSTADAIFNKDADLIQLTNCGNPPVSGSNFPSVTKVNIFAPSFTPNPIAPNFTGSCGSILLPVELVSFIGQCKENEIELTWQTASEENNDYFLIEKSEDGKNFSIIAKVFGHGNSNSTIYYNYHDFNILNSNYYYRLRQVDFNGQETESNDIFVPYNCRGINSTTINAFFNIESNEIIINSMYENEELTTVFMTDLAGRIVFSETLNLSSRTVIPVQKSISNSVYILGVKNTKNTYFKKLLINK